ncbi:MAG TPA: cytochrome c biogenesis protein ResB [Blastocatellia bacterium]|nr:cytochrome c biogenesis protein ResB [Blastocatellia bacterium]
MATTETEVAANSQAADAAEQVVKATSRKSKSIIDQVLGLLSSVRFGVTMLILLLICCMIGMLIMQVNVEGFDEYYQKLTPAQRQVYGALGFFDIYKASYFYLLLAVTGLNIVLASIDRFPTAWQYIAKPKLSASPNFIKAQMFNTETMMGMPAKAAAERIHAAWAKDASDRVRQLLGWCLVVQVIANVIVVVIVVKGWGPLWMVYAELGVWLALLAATLLWKLKRWPRRPVRISEENNRITVFAQRNTWNRLGAYVVHVALLTIFIGGFLTNRLGSGGQMEIRPGMRPASTFTTTEMALDGPQVSQASLPFAIECTDLQQKLVRPEGGLDAGNTIDWLSFIRIRDGGKMEDQLVHLNNVGSYRGYRFFQSAFQPMGYARQITVRFEPIAGGEARDVTIGRDDSVDVPGIGRVAFADFYPDFDEKTGENGSGDFNRPVALLQVPGGDGKPRAAMAFSPSLADEIYRRAAEKGGEDQLLVAGNKVILKHFEKVALGHILTIQYDPGRLPFYYGSVLLIMALMSVFLFSHQRMWAVVEQDGKGSKVYFGGNVNRNKPAFEGRFNTLVQSVIGGRSQQ